MQKTDLELMTAVEGSIVFASVALLAGAYDVVASDFLAELAVYGYEVVKKDGSHAKD